MHKPASVKLAANCFHPIILPSELRGRLNGNAGFYLGIRADDPASFPIHSSPDHRLNPPSLRFDSSGPFPCLSLASPAF